MCNGFVVFAAEQAPCFSTANLLNELLVALGSQLREQGMDLLQAALRGGQQLPDEVLHSIGHTGRSAWGAFAKMGTISRHVADFGFYT